MNAAQIGKLVKRWCASKASYALLDEIGAGDTWTSGGCVVLAYGLHELLPESVVVGLVQASPDGVDQIGHVGVSYQGHIIDADGAFSSPQKWLAHWNALEHVQMTRMVNVDDVDPEELPLPNDQQGSDQVTEALRPFIGQADANTIAAVLETAADRIDLGMTEVTENGVTFKTGQPVTFGFIRNTEKSPNFGARYQQDIEPHGRFLLHNENPGDPPRGWETGEVTFKKPLVLAFNTGEFAYNENSWKARLAAHYGKKGLALSRKLIQEGFDGIVTVYDGSTREIVDLSVISGRPMYEKRGDKP